MSEPARFSELTTIRVGGPIGSLVAPETRDDLVETLRGLTDPDDWMLLAGGSNTVAGDDGFDGTVVRVATRGIQVLGHEAGRVRVRIEAGENWDDFVAHAVGEGWSGVEALSGIPGSVGAAPIQNIGAYGQELADTLVAVEVFDDETGRVERRSAAELGLGYRTSTFKRTRRGVVLAVELALITAQDASHALSMPVAYQQLASALDVELGGRAPLADVRSAVRSLRAGKGMLLDEADPDSVSAGSFFTNPIVREQFARGLPSEAPRWALTADQPDLVAPLGPTAPEDTTSAMTNESLARLDEAARERAAAQQQPRLAKLSAAWLIEQAGVHKGYGLPGSRAAVSSKHTLAITNRGGASGAEIAQLASFVRALVQSEFGLLLQPEPVLVGLEL